MIDFIKTVFTVSVYIVVVVLFYEMGKNQGKIEGVQECAKIVNETFKEVFNDIKNQT